jgi:hypothetical protein
LRIDKCNLQYIGGLLRLWKKARNPHKAPYVDWPGENPQWPSVLGLYGKSDTYRVSKKCRLHLFAERTESIDNIRYISTEFSLANPGTSPTNFYFAINTDFTAYQLHKEF